jgi:mannosyltransferase
VWVVAPNFKRRLSGVTSTLERVVPVQARSLPVAAFGPGLKPSVPRIGAAALLGFWRAPAGQPFRIWHARRNVEMLAGLVMRDLLRMKLKLVFTSASQRHHTGWSRFLIGRMDAVVATSARTAAYLKRPATVVQHGIDAAAFRPPPSKATARAALGLPDLRLVGCFGRIRAQKGTDVFVRAMIAALKTRPDAGAVVLGRATAEHQAFLAGLQAEVAAAGLAERILFPPEVAPGETPAWYAALDVFVAPQRWEGFGVTPLEAMATGLPVVATTVGAFPDLVVPPGTEEAETGRLIAPGDVDAMAAATAAYLDDAAGAEEAGAAGRARVMRRFTLEREAAALNAVYEKLWREAGV